MIEPEEKNEIKVDGGVGTGFPEMAAIGISASI